MYIQEVSSKQEIKLSELSLPDMCSVVASESSSTEYIVLECILILPKCLWCDLTGNSIFVNIIKLWWDCKSEPKPSLTGVPVGSEGTQTYTETDLGVKHPQGTSIDQVTQSLEKLTRWALPRTSRKNLPWGHLGLKFSTSEMEDSKYLHH